MRGIQNCIGYADRETIDKAREADGVMACS